MKLLDTSKRLGNLDFNHNLSFSSLQFYMIHVNDFMIAGYSSFPHLIC